jgi:hypothetical protein
MHSCAVLVLLLGTELGTNAVPGTTTAASARNARRGNIALLEGTVVVLSVCSMFAVCRFDCPTTGMAKTLDNVIE